MCSGRSRKRRCFAKRSWTSARKWLPFYWLSEDIIIITKANFHHLLGILTCFLREGEIRVFWVFGRVSAWKMSLEYSLIIVELT